MRASVRFEPRDLWVGAFWTTNWRVRCRRRCCQADGDHRASAVQVGATLGPGATVARVLVVHLCLLPCLPVRLEFEGPAVPAAELDPGARPPRVALIHPADES